MGSKHNPKIRSVWDGSDLLSLCLVFLAFLYLCKSASCGTRSSTPFFSCIAMCCAVSIGQCPIRAKVLRGHETTRKTKLCCLLGSKSTVPTQGPNPLLHTRGCIAHKLLRNEKTLGKTKEQPARSLCITQRKMSRFPGFLSPAVGGPSQASWAGKPWDLMVFLMDS